MQRLNSPYGLLVFMVVPLVHYGLVIEASLMYYSHLNYSLESSKLQGKDFAKSQKRKKNPEKHVRIITKLFLSSRTNTATEGIAC